MAQIFAVNQNNDLYLVNNQMVLAFDLQAVLQGCAHAAQTRLGELVLAINEGIPYFQAVFNGVPNFQTLDAALRVAFLQVTGVVEVVSLILSRVPNSNTLTYAAIIRTIFGTGNVNG